VNLLSGESGSYNVSLADFGRRITPSILFHLMILAIVTAVPSFSLKQFSNPSVYTVSLVSAPSGKPLKERKRWITKEVGKTETVKKKAKLKPLKKKSRRVPITRIKKTDATKRITSKSKSTKKVVGKAIKRIREEESSRKITDAVSRIRGEVSEQRVAQAVGPGQRSGVINSEITNLRVKVYYTMIWGKIKKNWILPEGIAHNREDLKAVVSFKILRDGKIKGVRFENQSGNPYFDRSVLRAVEKAAPLPPLPREYKGGYLDIGVRFRSTENL